MIQLLDIFPEKLIRREAWGIAWFHPTNRLEAAWPMSYDRFRTISHTLVGTAKVALASMLSSSATFAAGLKTGNDTLPSP
jgi:hypothetical protein